MGSAFKASWRLPTLPWLHRAAPSSSTWLENAILWQVLIWQLHSCRLEREVLVTLPDAAARGSILRLLTRQLPLDNTVDLQR